MFDAIGWCKARQSHVCEHNELQEICGYNKINPYRKPYSNGIGIWYGDKGKDTTSGDSIGEFGTSNNEVCSDNHDGPAYDGSQLGDFRCCTLAA